MAEFPVRACKTEKEVGKDENELNERGARKHSGVREIVQRAVPPGDAVFLSGSYERRYFDEERGEIAADVSLERVNIVADKIEAEILKVLLNGIITDKKEKRALERMSGQEVEVVQKKAAEKRLFLQRRKNALEHVARIFSDIQKRLKEVVPERGIVATEFDLEDIFKGMEDLDDTPIGVEALTVGTARMHVERSKERAPRLTFKVVNIGEDVARELAKFDGTIRFPNMLESSVSEEVRQVFLEGNVERVFVGDAVIKTALQARENADLNVDGK